MQDADGVELADSWFDWINWNYLGYQGPDKNPGQRELLRARPQRRDLETRLPTDVRRGGHRGLGGELRIAATQHGQCTSDDPQRSSQLLRPPGPRHAAGDHHPSGKARRRGRAARHAGPRRAARDQLQPRRFQRPDPPAARPLVAIHDGRSEPVRPATGVPPVRPNDRRDTAALRHTDHHAGPRRRRTIP